MPLHLEIGPKDLKKKHVLSVRCDSGAEDSLAMHNGQPGYCPSRQAQQSQGRNTARDGKRKYVEDVVLICPSG